MLGLLIVCVCVCVCVCVRERERETDRQTDRARVCVHMCVCVCLKVQWVGCNVIPAQADWRRWREQRGWGIGPTRRPLLTCLAQAPPPCFCLPQPPGCGPAVCGQSLWNTSLFGQQIRTMLWNPPAWDQAVLHAICIIMFHAAVFTCLKSLLPVLSCV